MISATDVLPEARKWLFVREVMKNGKGTNTGRWVEAIQRIGGTVKGQPWCACFVCVVLGLLLGGKLPFPYTASCDTLLEWARSKGVLYDDPMPGDIFLLMASYHDAQHTGFVSEGITDTHFGSIEGNASDPEAPPSRDGFGSFERDVHHEKARSIGRNYKYVRWSEALSF
jgi:hypothetical protein